MLQGVDLAKAIANAMERKAAAQGLAKLTQAEIGRALSMSQPSVSELLKFGRLAKEKIPTLLEYFSDVVGPDHFGFPVSKFEMEFIQQLRRLPAGAQAALMARVKESAQAVATATADLAAPLADPSGKRDHRAAA